MGTVKIVQAALRQGGMAAAETFCRIPPDSSIQVVNQIAGLYRQAQCDSLIAVGGGSVIDTAKGVGMVLAQAGSDLLDSAGCEVLPGPMSPLWRCPPPRAPAARPPWWPWWPTRRSR
ncbi:MAG: iron-containing alcohol dehydrogenase [Evtepia gabavorous]